MNKLKKLRRWIDALPKRTKIVGGVIFGGIALALVATGLVVATRDRHAPPQRVSGAPASCKRAIVLSRAAAGAQVADQGSRQYRPALEAAQNRCENDPSAPAACKESVELDAEFWDVVDEGGSPYEWANGAGRKGDAQMNARDACDYKSSRAPLPQAMQSTPYQSGFRCVVHIVAQGYGVQEAYRGCAQAGMSKYGAPSAGYGEFVRGAVDAMVCISDHGTSGCPTSPAGGTSRESGPSPPSSPTSGTPSSGIETASLGSVKAELQYSATRSAADSTSGVEVQNVRLIARRAGKLVFGRQVECGHTSCYLEYYTASGREHLAVAQLQPGEPHVIVNLWSGGMRCCITTMIYRIDNPDANPTITQWDSAGLSDGLEGLKDVNGDGYSEFVARDTRFPTYASVAEARFPLQIFALRNGKLEDVTRGFPDLLSIDSKALWSEYESARKTTKSALQGGTVNGCFDSCRGFLGAWAAEQALLGRWKAASAALQKALQRRELEGEMSGPATGKAYLARLEAFLRRTGYLNSSASAQH